MPTNYISMIEAITAELVEFIESRARALSRADLERLILDLPLLRRRLTEISSQTYPYLADQVEFLSMVVEHEVAEGSRRPVPPAVGEAAFALLYFQDSADLIPDSIPGLGLLDDATIVNMVLRRHEDAFRSYSHGEKLWWPAPCFDIDELISVVSSQRLATVCRSAGG